MGRIAYGFGDHGVGNVKGGSEVAHEGVEKFLTRDRGGSGDDVLQGGFCFLALAHFGLELAHRLFEFGNFSMGLTDEAIAEAANPMVYIFINFVPLFDHG
jgi:hypothetical protein